jgi:serine O-acetyltransferase
MIAWDQTKTRLRDDWARLDEHFDTLPGQRPTRRWFHPSYQCVLLHRLSYHFYARRRRMLARVFWHLNLLLTGCDIAPLSNVGGGLVIHFPLAIGLIGTVGRNCTIEGHGGIGGGTRRHEDIGAGPGLPVVGDDVVLGWGALIMGPIRVGHRVAIGHGAVVTTDVPDDTVVPDRELVLLRSRVSA